MCVAIQSRRLLSGRRDPGREAYLGSYTGNPSVQVRIVAPEQRA
jgi:hypothetical protein